MFHGYGSLPEGTPSKVLQLATEKKGKRIGFQSSFFRGELWNFSGVAKYHKYVLAKESPPIHQFSDHREHTFHRYPWSSSSIQHSTTQIHARRNHFPTIMYHLRLGNRPFYVIWLVVSTQFEKYESKWESSPIFVFFFPGLQRHWSSLWHANFRGENKECLKPTAR